MGMKKVTVIGAGTMGNGIAHVFAQSGFETRLTDVSAAALEKAIGTITKNLPRSIQTPKMEFMMGVFADKPAKAEPLFPTVEANP